MFVCLWNVLGWSCNLVGFSLLYWIFYSSGRKRHVLLCWILTAMLSERNTKTLRDETLTTCYSGTHLYSLDLASRDVKIMNPAKNIGQVPVVANVIFLISKIYFLIFKSYFWDMSAGCATNLVLGATIISLFSYSILWMSI